ncbi:MAG: hypothetical protein ROD09_10850 [Candidatus Sedimenticola sp. (ex Thyasira tokunagai)]
MPYVQRNKSGDIIALYRTVNEHATELLAHDNEEVIQFLLVGTSEEETKDFLSRTDAEMVRVVEDLVELLVQKNLILFTELPIKAQEKFINRRKLRQKIHPEEQLLVDDEYTIDL